MKTRFNIHLWSRGSNTPEADEIFNASLHREYTNEGDEFIDDSIRSVDQAFDQIDGSFEVWQRRSMQVSSMSNEIVNSKNNPT